MRGVSACPSRLALYLLLQKPMKTSGKPALVSPCRNLPDYLAEREGFEPSRPVSQPTRLAGERLQPLGHLSARNFSASPPAGG